MQWPRDYVISVGYLLQITIYLFGMIALAQFTWRCFKYTDPEPSQFELYWDRRTPTWLKRVLDSLHPDDVTFISFLVGAALIGVGFWVFGLYTDLIRGFLNVGTVNNAPGILALR